MADEVQGQADHEHTGAESRTDGEADQHDQHPLEVSLGVAWNGQEGQGTRSGLPTNPPWLQSPPCPGRLQTSTSRQACPSGLLIPAPLQ